MDLVRTPQEMARVAAAHVAAGRRIGLVPTMGALHHGHATLLDLLRPRCDVLVVSVYVNPLQFGPTEDLARYPRTPEADAALCERHGADAVFLPVDLYPDGFATSVAVHGLTEGLCGASRPGHFEGVATVVARLFGVTRAAVATFGEKDFQQLMVLRRMVEDLALPVQIVPAPLVRDADGLASSSRNRYLGDAERSRALTLHRALHAVRDAVAAGERRAEVLVALGRGLVDCDRLDYFELVDARTLRPLPEVGDAPARALVAAFYGRTRLIDNVAVGAPLAW